MMKKKAGMRPAEKAEAAPFTTIDDCVLLVQELAMHLGRLGEYKHPLSVRKGVMRVSETEESKTVKAGSRTYFLDRKQSKEGRSFLVITESRFKGEGGDRERTSIVVFPDHAEAFSQAVSEMAADLNQQSDPNDGDD